MSGIDETLASVLIDRYSVNAARVRELAAPLTNVQFWQKPFPYGNSFGHLVLHLTGNLNYYIGAQIAKTGYVRDRPREFNNPNPPPKEEALKRLDEAVAIVQQTIRAHRPPSGRKNIQVSARAHRIASIWLSSAPPICSTTSVR